MSAAQGSNVIKLDTARTLEAIGREVCRLADELTSVAETEDNARECAALKDLAAFLEYSACRLGDIPIAEDPRVAWLNEVCLCGHERGEHYVQAPHTCEGVALEGFPSCRCRGFEAESSEPPATGEAS